MEYFHLIVNLIMITMFIVTNYYWSKKLGLEQEISKQWEILAKNSIRDLGRSVETSQELANELDNLLSEVNHVAPENRLS